MFSEDFLIPSAIVLCIGIYISVYLSGIQKRNVKPVLATWVLFALAAILSFVTDLAETGTEGIQANFFNLADSCAILLILGVVLWQKDTRRSFTSFEKWCIGIALIVALVWLASGQNVLAHLSIQVILFIAYVPTLKHLWASTRSTESLSMWFFNFLAALLGIIEPLRTMSLLPTVYAARAVICTSLVMIFILRLQLRQSQSTKEQ